MKPEISRFGEGAIPRILIGCWQLAEGHRGRTALRGDALGHVLSELALNGFSTFDMADIYTGVERRLGQFRQQWIADGHDSSHLRFHTKLVPDRNDLGRLSAVDIEETVARSKQRLGVARLDLVQLHWWDFSVPGWLEAAKALEGLRTRGWVRQLGVTNFDTQHLRDLIDAGVPIVSNQVQFSLLDRRPLQQLVPFCQRQGIHLLTYGTLAGGFLSERWLGEPDPGTEVANRSLVKYRLIIQEFGGWDAFQDLLETLASIAEKHGVSIANLAVRWVLDQPQVAAVIVGLSDLERTLQHARVFSITLDATDRQEIDQVIGDGTQGSVYGLERVPGGRHATIMKTNLNQSNG